MNRQLRVAALLAIAWFAAPGGAQSPDRAAGPATPAHAATDLRRLEASLRGAPGNVELLWRASEAAIDLGEFNDARRDSLYAVAEHYARRAIAAEPGSSMAHFVLSKALGRRALSRSPRDRLRFAAEVRKEALSALALDSINAGAWNVLGMWHAEVMRLSGVSRFVGKRLLGAAILDKASWAEAVRSLERAVALEPGRIVHRLNLAGVYADTGHEGRAREQYAVVLRLPQTDYNDARYQQAALRELGRLR